MAQPKFQSNELLKMVPDGQYDYQQLPRPFKYDLNQIYPDAKSEKNKEIMQEFMYFYESKGHKLIKSLLILNRHGVFTYRSLEEYQRDARKPTIIIPFAEISCIISSRVKKDRVLKSRSAQLLNNECGYIYLISMRLRTNYYATVQSIMNFAQGDYQQYDNPYEAIGYDSNGQPDHLYYLGRMRPGGLRNNSVTAGIKSVGNAPELVFVHKDKEVIEKWWQTIANLAVSQARNHSGY